MGTMVLSRELRHTTVTPSGLSVQLKRSRTGSAQRCPRLNQGADMHTCSHTCHKKVLQHCGCGLPTLILDTHSQVVLSRGVISNVQYNVAGIALKHGGRNCKGTECCAIREDSQAKVISASGELRTHSEGNVRGRVASQVMDTSPTLVELLHLSPAHSYHWALVQSQKQMNYLEAL